MSLSKIDPLANCAEIIHPWSESCPYACWKMFCGAIPGTAKLILPFILISYGMKVFKKKKLDRKITRDFLIDYFRCILVGICIPTSLVFYSCLFRYLLGKYTGVMVLNVPTFLSCLWCILYNPIRRQLMTVSISNLALESIVMHMAHTGKLTLNVYTKTLFFMVTNACLMYSYRVSKSKPLIYTWFFKPDKDDNISDENGKLITEKLFKKTRTYFTFGLVFGILSTLIKDITVMKPKNIHKLFTAKTIRLGLFAGLYVAVYESTIYFLNRSFKRNRSAIFAWPAGFLAGLTYAIEPSLSINVSVLINLIQILYNRINEPLRRLVPMDIICYCSSLSILIHMQMYYPKSYSSMGSKILRMTTAGKSDLIMKALNKFTINIL